MEESSLTPKNAQRLDNIGALAGELGSHQEAAKALADCVQALKRAKRRAEPLPEEYDRVEIAQRRGPRLEFTGRLLAEDEFTSRGTDPMRVRFEIWQTIGEALVAASYTWPEEREGVEIASARVVPPCEDMQAMHLAVMDHFDWADRARSMARKLGWDLRMDVD